MREVDIPAYLEPHERDDPQHARPGEILLDQQDIHGIDVVGLRPPCRHGLSANPNPFPKSIYENVAYGLRVNGFKGRARRSCGKKLTYARAALWEEVKDYLKKSAFALSGGQQQRLCIARALLWIPRFFARRAMLRS